MESLLLSEVNSAIYMYNRIHLTVGVGLTYDQGPHVTYEIF